MLMQRIGSFLLLVSTLAHAKTITSTATVYPLDSASKEILFRFEETRVFGPTTVVAKSRYIDPTGTDAVKETVQYENGAFRVYTVEKLQTGESGRVEYRGDRVHFYYRDAKGREHRAEEKLESNTLHQDALNPFILNHWKKLEAGETLDVRYIVPQRTETIGFSLSKESTGTCQDRPATIVKMRPSSFFINLMVAPVFLSYLNDETHTLCEVRGRTTPYKKTPNGWKDLDAHTVFTLHPRH